MKKFFIGIDSDGTAFDSMTKKHCDAFIPTMIKIWNLEKYVLEVTKINEKINLYSSTRGVNRFIGLKMAFDCMKDQNIPIPDYHALEGFLDSKMGLSNVALREHMKVDKDPFLEEALDWSMQADVIFSEKTEALEPFKYVKEVLVKASEYADIVVISSASSASLHKDWERTGLTNYLTDMLGQEAGSKKEQLILSAMDKYDTTRILMLGDALGDLDAVQSVKGLFYPIIPSREEASWKRFLYEGISKFIEEEFEGAYQEELLEEFMQILK